jgi:hypothetical protein
MTLNLGANYRLCRLRLGRATLPGARTVIGDKSVLTVAVSLPLSRYELVQRRDDGVRAELGVLTTDN